MKKILALLILATGGIIASFIISSAPAGQKTGLFAETSNKANPSLSFKSKPSAFTGALPVLRPSLSPQNTNLTENLGQAYAEAIANLNSDSIQSPNGLSELKAPSQELTNEILQKQISQGLSFGFFNKKDIKISDKTSAADQLAYLETLGNLSEKNFGNLRTNFIEMLDEWALRQNNKPLEDYLSRIPQQIDDLLSLTVPSSLADFHLQNLNLWQKKLVVFTALINLNEDPLKTYLAIQELPAIADESLALQDFVEEKYETLKK